MRQAGLNKIYELAQLDPNVFFIGSDLGFKVLENFKKNLPDQFIMEGVSEANIIGMSAGIALEGGIVYVNTIATFLTRRCLDQICINLGLEKVKVRLFASGGGLVYGPLGPTHMALDDIALMRTIPNMTILAPADKNQMLNLLNESKEYNGPIYFRVGRGGEEEIETSEKVKIGKAMTLKKGSKISFCTTGTMAQIVLKVANELENFGLSVDVLHFHTIVPLDREALLNSIKDKTHLYVFEEHFSKGGLYGEISELLIGLSPLNIKINSFSVGFDFIATYGKQADLLKQVGLDFHTILNKVKLDFEIN